MNRQCIRTAVIVAGLAVPALSHAATRTGSFMVSVTIVDDGCRTETARTGVNVSCGRGTAYAIHLNPMPTDVQPDKIVPERQEAGWVLATVWY